MTVTPQSGLVNPIPLIDHWILAADQRTHVLEAKSADSW